MAELNLEAYRDPRWSRVKDRDWTCASCGETHRGLFDLVTGRPTAWPDGDDWRPNHEALEADHILTEDFCILRGEHFFIRCLLHLPILGAEPGEVFGFGIWSTLSRQNFDLYLETFDDGEQGSLGPWFGWFSNDLVGYPDTLHLKCKVLPRDNRQRPTVELEPTDHPLAIEQRDGITLERLFAIYALNGHDMRSVLLD